MARSSRAVASKLRTRPEIARLNLLALFRAVDQMPLDPNKIPQDLLHQLFELDADFAEAPWALDQPPRLDFNAVLCDTTAALSISWRPVPRSRLTDPRVGRCLQEGPNEHRIFKKGAES